MNADSRHYFTDPYKQVYTSTGSVTALPVPTVKNTSLPGNWEYQRCIRQAINAPHSGNAVNAVVMRDREPEGGRVFPNQIINADNNTVEGCLNQCAKFGYPAAGMEFGRECCE